LIHADLEIGAAERVREAYSLAADIWREHPDQTESRRDLAQAAFKMGETSADRTAAAKYYAEALTQFEFLARHPDVAASAAKLGGIERDQGNLLAALSHFSRVLQIAEADSAKEGANARVATRLSVAAANADVGEVLLRNGARAEGVPKLKKALGIYRELGESGHVADLEEKLRQL
jgi:tetratricopeptide (TPR) repeat protein